MSLKENKKKCRAGEETPVVRRFNAADPCVADLLFFRYLFLHQHLKAAVAEGDTAAVGLTLEAVEPCCYW